MDESVFLRSGQQFLGLDEPQGIPFGLLLEVGMESDWGPSPPPLFVSAYLRFALIVMLSVWLSECIR